MVWQMGRGGESANKANDGPVVASGKWLWFPKAAPLSSTSISLGFPARAAEVRRFGAGARKFARVPPRFADSRSFASVVEGVHMDRSGGLAGMWTDPATGMEVRAVVPVEAAGGLRLLPASGESENSRIEEIRGEVMEAVGLAMGSIGDVVAEVGEEGVDSSLLGGILRWWMG
ncbi:hypothetical protein GUJ93_ZPchr0458g22766 [Zizania palustris]|uniref:Uncharacterized protein n=1 Tax=Zizania palustris TaxID=103762 RepID=A0A8J5VEV1_ZIZPA|nr:hypothetical protein GUJ93_ZPchr0458g22766 [Zizania palustris]